MKLARFRWGEAALYGIVEGQWLYEVEGDVFGEWNKGPGRVRMANVTLLAPVSPSKVVCLAQNWARDRDTPGREEPRLFLKAPTTVIGPGEAILYPKDSQRVVYEVELGVVIKKQMRNVAEKDVRQHILGFTSCNDLTAMDLYERDLRRSRGKTFDTFCPTGPYIATDIEPGNVRLRSWVNGELRQNSNSRDMTFSVEEFVSFASRVVTLLPGDLVLMGSPPGVGPVQPGDVVEVEVEGVGRLRNPVVAAP